MPEGPRVTINLFCNEGEGLYSRIQTEHGWAAVTPTQFLEGWQGKRPPFSNNETRGRETIPEGTYEAAGWSNVETRAKYTDPSGRARNVIVERRGEKVHLPGDPTPPDEAPRQRLVYLNLQIKPASPRAAPRDRF